MPSARPTAPLDLKIEAFGILDLLDAQQATVVEPPSPEVRKAQLLALVQEAAAQQGRTYSTEVLTQAVAQWVDGPAPVVAPPSVLARSAAATQAKAQGLWHRLTRWWRDARSVHGLLGGVVVSVLAGLALWLIPWGTVFQAPFVLAVTHGWLYIGALLAGAGILLTLIAYAAEEGLEGLDICAKIALALVLIVGPLGGLISSITAQSTTDLASFRVHLKQAVDTVAEARAHLPPGASVEAILTAAQKNPNNPRYPNYVGDYEERTQTLRWGVDLNPTECQALNDTPDPAFHVVSVNGQPSQDGKLVCPYHWWNRVEVAMPMAP